MSLTQRKARPLVRDAQSLRDDRLFIVACDDTYAPKQYFGFFQMPRIQVYVEPTKDGEYGAANVLDRLQSLKFENDDERWMLLDVDHHAKGPHLQSFLSAIKSAKQQGIKVALSKPCFEFWLLLHHNNGSGVNSPTDCKTIEVALRAKLGEYNKTNLKPEHYPIESVAKACEQAAALDATVSGGDIPGANTTRVYQLWKAIAAKALPSQLPPELRSLIP
jgi:hypothetical protein